MSSWQNFFDEIYLINLDKRLDRYKESLRQFEEYGIINFKRISAIENIEGARGLRDTMLLIFKEALEKDYKSILVLEDDFEFVKEKIWVDEVMSAAINELPENWLLLYGGGQPTKGFSTYYSAHLLPVVGYFATQFVAYSQQALKEILARDFQYPIDNWYVKEIQEGVGHCYCVHPMLVSQRPDFSNIGNTFIDWRPFMDVRHEQQINELNNRLNANKR